MILGPFLMSHVPDFANFHKCRCGVSICKERSLCDACEPADTDDELEQLMRWIPSMTSLDRLWRIRAWREIKAAERKLRARLEQAK